MARTWRGRLSLMGVVLAAVLCLAARPSVRSYSKVVLTSAARTAGTETAVIDAEGYTGAYITWDITAAPNTADTVQIHVQVVQPNQTGVSSGAELYRTVFAGSAALAGTALQSGNRLQSCLMYPGAVETGDQNNSVVQGMPLPPRFRIVTTHSGSGSFTYSISVHFIP